VRRRRLVAYDSAVSSWLTVRPARVEDVAQMARVNVRCWQETYRGLMSDAVLDDPGFPAARERFWTAALTDERYRENRVAVAERDGELVGIAMSGPPLDAAATWARQLYVLYVTWTPEVPGWTMAAQARVLRVTTGGESPVIITARACLAPPAYWRRPLTKRSSSSVGSRSMSSSSTSPKPGWSPILAARTRIEGYGRGRECGATPTSAQASDCRPLSA
jgi:hypothetical protein